MYYDTLEEIKNHVSPLPLYKTGDTINVDGAYGVVYYSGETPVNKCYDPFGYTLWQIVITSCNMKDVLKYWCSLKSKLLEIDGVYDVQTLMGVPYLVQDDHYEMIIKFKKVRK